MAAPHLYPNEKAAMLKEHSRAILVKDVTSGGKTVPAGAQGTVVAIYRDGRAYEVEFTRPFHCVVTVEADAVR